VPTTNTRRVQLILYAFQKESEKGDVVIFGPWANRSGEADEETMREETNKRLMQESLNIPES
jgi:hypothetical protein